MVDLKTTYAGINLKNPLVIGGGPTTATPRICEKAAKAGWAGVALKLNLASDVIETICADAQTPKMIPRPFYKLVDARGDNKWKPTIPKVKGKRSPGEIAGEVVPKDYQLVCWNQNVTSPKYQFYAGFSCPHTGPEEYLWDINKTKEVCEPYDCKVIANVTAYTTKGWEEQLNTVNKSKADAVELVISCPAVGLYDDRVGKVRRLHTLDTYPEIVEKATKFYIDRSDKPVSVKLAPDYTLSLLAPIEAAIRGGAKSVNYGDAPMAIPLAPSLIINPDNLEVGLFPGAPWQAPVQQSWALPFICGALARFRMSGIDIDIAGCGSARDYLDIIRLFMAGASSVQVCTATLVEGVGIAKDYLQGITTWLESKGYKSLKDIQGIVANEEKLTIDPAKFVRGLMRSAGGSLPDQRVVVSEKKCINCGWCEACCPDVAITIPDKTPAFDEEFCEVCGMCVAVCPTEALSLEPR